MPEKKRFDFWYLEAFLIWGFLFFLMPYSVYVDKRNCLAKAHDAIYIELSDVEEAEYGSIFMPDTLIRNYAGDLEIVSTVHTGEVGTYDVIYHLKGEDTKYKRRVDEYVTKTVQVIDTMPPVIGFEKEDVTVFTGQEYDFLHDNVLRIYDVVDGDLPEEQLSYETDADLTKAGEYTVTLKATDRNGLQQEASYKLTVKRRPKIVVGESYERCKKILQGYGYNRAAVAGILANIKFESTFNPNDTTGIYYGLCQWGGGRRENLYAYCAANGLDASTIEGQLAFMQYELTNRYGRVYRDLLACEDSADGAYYAAVRFCNGYEGAATDRGRGDLGYNYYIAG